eukprot:1161921-Pelagomonas_calceolata.AAC.9
MEQKLHGMTWCGYGRAGWAAGIGKWVKLGLGPAQQGGWSWVIDSLGLSRAPGCTNLVFFKMLPFCVILYLMSNYQQESVGQAGQQQAIRLDMQPLEREKEEPPIVPESIEKDEELQLQPSMEDVAAEAACWERGGSSAGRGSRHGGAYSHCP